MAILTAACSGGVAFGQGGLREIPDTRVEAQLEAFKLPEGAKINLFASEPMIVGVGAEFGDVCRFGDAEALPEAMLKAEIPTIVELQTPDIDVG